MQLCGRLQRRDGGYDSFPPLLLCLFFLPWLLPSYSLAFSRCSLSALTPSLSVLSLIFSFISAVFFSPNRHPCPLSNLSLLCFSSSRPLSFSFSLSSSPRCPQIFSQPFYLILCRQVSLFLLGFFLQPSKKPPLNLFGCGSFISKLSPET